MTSSTNASGASIVVAALAIAQHGSPVLPCSPATKKPLIARGFHAASREPQTIRRWWQAHPAAMIAVSTGPAIGAWILDPDAPETPGEPDGEAALRVLEERNGFLPATYTIRTPGGGRHLYFRWDDANPIGTASGALPDGVHVRGRGGYVIVPPSRRLDGRAYVVETDSPFADAPAWLIRLIRDRPEPQDARPMGRPVGRPDRYGIAVLDRESALLANAPRGSRNPTLNRVAFRLFQLVASGELDPDSVVSALIEACHATGSSARTAGVPSTADDRQRRAGRTRESAFARAA